MAALQYTVIQVDQDRWGTLASLQANLDASGAKQLTAAPDPQVDPTLVNREDAFTYE
jgi:hypothetical protein